MGNRKHSVFPEPVPVVTMVALGLLVPTEQPSPGAILMFEGVKRHGEAERDDLVRISGTKGAAQLHPRSFEQSGVRIVQEAFKGLIHRLLTKIEGRLQVEQHLLTNVIGEVDGEHGNPYDRCQ